MHLRLLGLVLALAPLPVAAQSLRDALPQGIVVQGKASVKTAPDMAVLSIELRGDGATADAASTALAAAQKAVIGGIAALDPAASYRTGDVSMREVRKGDCASTGDAMDLALSAMADGEKEKDKGPCRVVGHVATIEATVEMRAVDKAGTAIGLASRLGASAASLEGFELRDPAAVRRSATAAAIADARSRAEALATASGAKLGPVVSILDGNGRDMALMEIAEPRAMMMAPALRFAPPPVEIAVSPKPVETSAEILIVYALIK